MNQAASGTKKRSKILSMALIALFAALTAVLSQIAIPTPWQIPISLGNLAGFLAVGLLTWEEAALSQVVWVLLGVVGAPVFSGIATIPPIFCKDSHSCVFFNKNFYLRVTVNPIVQ